MGKLVVIIVGIICVMGLGLGGFFYVSDSSQDLDNTKETNIPTEEISQEEQEKEKTEELIHNRIEKIRKRLALKGLIIQGDTYFQGGQLTLALKSYLDFYKQNSDDPLIISKIAETYAQMHKFGSSVNYYEKLENLDSEQKKQYILYLLLSSDYSDQQEQKKLEEKLQGLDLSEEELFYYINSLRCSNDFHECKKKFASYFWNDGEENDDQGEEIDKELTFTHLLSVKTSIENYRNFRLDDVALKNTYMLGAWYSNGWYSLSAHIGKQELKERPDYKPLLKIVAQSYFNLGDYRQAREYLGQYHEVDASDPAINYLLGVVNSELREHVLANIYFKKALSLGYENKKNIYRYMIHTFFLLDDHTNMLKTFERLVVEEDISEHDMRLGIFYHIAHEKYDIALSWSQKSQRLFPENIDFIIYEGWILREIGSMKEAETLLKKLEEDEKENPFLLINLGYLEREKGNTNSALIYFKQVLKHAGESEFAIGAQKEIDIISEEKQQASEQKKENTSE